jgi:predicted ferric reductase
MDELQNKNTEGKKMKGNFLERAIDYIGEIGAFLTIVLIIVMYLNANWGFLPANLVQTMGVVRELAILIVVSMKAVEFALHRRIVWLIITLAIIAVAVGLMFFPESMSFLN